MAWMAQLVRAQVSYECMTVHPTGNPEVVSSILTPSTFLASPELFAVLYEYTFVLPLSSRFTTAGFDG